MNRFWHVVLCLLATTAPVYAQTTRPVPGIENVLIISIDGLRPDVLLRADTPNMHRMYENGSFTFWAKSTAQSITLPTHVSMLTGVIPEVHAIMWNVDLPFDKPLYPAVPTIFELAKQASLTTAVVSGKHKFCIFCKPGIPDWNFFPPTKETTDADVIEHADEILREHRPRLMFVHLPETDTVAHKKGWGSPEQLATVAGADACVGRLIDDLKALNLTDSTLVILTSDHGGAGRTHGPEDPRSRSIPWIVSGPHVRKNFDLTLMGHDVDVQTFDTFSTACAVLGLHAPVTEHMSGRFVEEAFDTGELMVSTFEPKMIPSTQP
jgi:arylsulfatase A-like enzyme